MAAGALRPLFSCSYYVPAMASKSSRRAPSPKINGSPSRQRQQQQQEQERRKQKPSIAEVQRAIGVTSDSFQTPTATPYSPSASSPQSPPPPSSSTSSSSSSSFLDFLTWTPIGQPEGEAERKLREAAEWMVERTEPHELSGQRTILLVCLSILPVWIFLLLVASGILKLPFDLPFWSDLIA